MEYKNNNYSDEQMIDILTKDDINSIKESIAINDVSFLTSVLQGDGFTQYNNLSSKQLQDEFNDRYTYGYLDSIIHSDV